MKNRTNEKPCERTSTKLDGKQNDRVHSSFVCSHKRLKGSIFLLFLCEGVRKTKKTVFYMNELHLVFDKNMQYILGKPLKWSECNAMPKLPAF